MIPGFLKSLPDILAYNLKWKHNIGKHKHFTFKLKELEYFYHSYNKTWKNERCIEIPIAISYYEKFVYNRILEIGCVLPHYGYIGHDIIDKYEKFPGIINKDIITYNTDKKYDLILSISTLEHIPGPDLIDMFVNIGKMLTKKGKLIFTIPIGYNKHIDSLIFTGAWVKSFPVTLTRNIYYKRTGLFNTWQICNKNDIRGKKYNSPYRYANGLIICES